MLNALSVDVEEYFQVANFSDVISRSSWDSTPGRAARLTHELIDLFDASDARATFFVLGWLAEREPELIREIVKRGHELASHGYSHELIYKQDERAFREETRRSKSLLEDVAGVTVRGYRAASFSITKKSLWALDVLAEVGFEYDSSIFPIRHNRYGISGAPQVPVTLETLSGATIQEFPLSTLRLGGAELPISGGGYFRLYPYWFTRYGLRKINNRDHRPFVFYCHPWEFDPDQPRVKASAFNSWRHYQNMGKSKARLQQLLRDFRLSTIAEVLAKSECPLMRIRDFVGAA